MQHKMVSGWSVAHRTAFILLLFSTSGVARADLQWSQKELNLAAEPGVTKIDGAFIFQNDGDHKVTITSVKPSCGCTTAELSQESYGPGQAGTIKVSFTVGDRVGSQVKKVVVRTDDPDQPVTTLTLRVDLMPRFELTPKLLMWKADEPREPKTVTLTVHGERPQSVEEASLLAPDADAAPESEATPASGLGVELKEVEAGRAYEVTVTPPSDAGDVRQMVYLRPKREPGQAEDAAATKAEQTLRFLVRVIGPPDKAPTQEAASAVPAE